MENLERRSQVMGEGRREQNTDRQIRVTWITDLRSQHPGLLILQRHRPWRGSAEAGSGLGP